LAEYLFARIVRKIEEYFYDKSQEPELGASGSWPARGMGVLSAGLILIEFLLLLCLSYFIIFKNEK
jgi:hypothetical protein